MTVTVTLSSSCESGVIDLGSYSEQEVAYALNQLREEAVEGFGNCCVEEYLDDELVAIREWTGNSCTTIKLSDAPGAGGLAIFEE